MFSLRACQRLNGLLNTFLIGVASIFFGVLETLIGIAHVYRPKVLRYLAIAYIDVFRATLRFLVMLILIYYALPFCRGYLSAWTSALLLHGYGGIFGGSVPVRHRKCTTRPVQLLLRLEFHFPVYSVESGSATGDVHIIIPLETTSNCVSLQGHRILASTVALPEHLKEAQDAQALYANPTPLIGAALIYLILLLPLVPWSRFLSAVQEESDGHSGFIGGYRQQQ